MLLSSWSLWRRSTFLCRCLHPWHRTCPCLCPVECPCPCPWPWLLPFPFLPTCLCSGVCPCPCTFQEKVFHDHSGCCRRSLAESQSSCLLCFSFSCHLPTPCRLQCEYWNCAPSLGSGFCGFLTSTRSPTYRRWQCQPPSWES
jgi:hypothetical protein